MRKIESETGAENGKELREVQTVTKYVCRVINTLFVEAFHSVSIDIIGVRRHQWSDLDPRLVDGEHVAVPTQVNKARTRSRQKKVNTTHVRHASHCVVMDRTYYDACWGP